MMNNPVQNPANPMDLLNDIQLPDPVSWWPPAIGWWLVLGLIIAIGMCIHWWVKRNRWKRSALKQLNSVTLQNSQTCYYQINRLLKTVAIQRFGQQAAPLSGEKWLAFLDSKVKQPLFLPAIKGFATAPDVPDAQLDAFHIKRIAEKWIRKHRC